MIFISRVKVLTSTICLWILFSLLQIVGMMMTGWVFLPETIPQVMVDVISLIPGIPAIVFTLLLSFDLDSGKEE